MAAGFTFRERPNGATPTIKEFVMKDTETLTAGDMLNLEAAGEVDLAATGDTNLLGVVLKTVAGIDSTTKVRCITDPDAIYSVVDNNARAVGDTLDIAGTTGAQGVASSSNKEFVCAATTSATEETLVRINVGKHHESKAQ